MQKPLTANVGLALGEKKALAVNHRPWRDGEHARARWGTGPFGIPDHETAQSVRRWGRAGNEIESRGDLMTAKYAGLIAAGVWAMICAGCGDSTPSRKNAKEQDSRVLAFVGHGGVAPSPGGEAVLMAFTGTLIAFPGDDVYMTFTLNNNDSESSLTLNGLPRRRDGHWLDGAIVFDGEIIAPLAASRNAGSGAAPPPCVIPPGMSAFGKTLLNDHCDFRATGDFKAALELDIEHAKRGPLRLKSEPCSFSILPNYALGGTKKEVKALRAAVSALAGYYVDCSSVPPPRFVKGRPILPVRLTTPIGYISKEQARAVEELAIFTTARPFTCWLVAAKGPDKVWNLEPLFYSTAYFGAEDIIPLMYDPTNGAKSAGDLMIRSTQVFSGDASVLDPSFKIQGGGYKP